MFRLCTEQTVPYNRWAPTSLIWSATGIRKSQFHSFFAWRRFFLQFPPRDESSGRTSLREKYYGTKVHVHQNSLSLVYILRKNTPMSPCVDVITCILCTLFICMHRKRKFAFVYRSNCWNSFGAKSKKKIVQNWSIFYLYINFGLYIFFY